MYFESARVPKKVYAGVSHTERFRKWSLGTGRSYTSNENAGAEAAVGARLLEARLPGARLLGVRLLGVRLLGPRLLRPRKRKLYCI